MNEAATAKQLALLGYLGQPVTETISKQEAADRIDAIVGNSDGKDKFGDWNDDKLILFPDLFADEIAALKKGCFAEYNAFRTEGPKSPDLPKVSRDQAIRIFTYLDATRPGWMKPRTATFLDHFLPCVKAKIHLSPTHSFPPPTTAPAQPQSSTARKRRKSEFLGKGALVQLLAIVLFFIVAPFAGGLVACILALVLFVIGSSMSSSWICGACGNKLSDKNVKVCPTCRSTFTR